MSEPKVIEGDFMAGDARFAIAAARFNDYIVRHLVDGALDTLQRHGVTGEAVDVVHAPGSFELPLVAQRLAATGRYEAVIALGAIIRGGTAHFDYIAGECARGLAAVSREQSIPVAFGVLTVDTVEQAIERAGAKGGNKGAEAAATALEMVSLLRRIGT